MSDIQQVEREAAKDAEIERLRAELAAERERWAPLLVAAENLIHEIKHRYPGEPLQAPSFWALQDAAAAIRRGES